MSDDRRALVTGARGFVGRQTLAPLIARGFDVHAASRRPRPGDLGDIAVTWHQADLLDRDARRELLGGIAPSHLLHAAWYLEPGKYTGSPHNLDWVAASIDLARRFEASGGRRVVSVGSCFEYEHGKTALLRENSSLEPATVYGEAKLSLATAMDALGHATELSSAWARLFYLYGPHEDRRRLIADIITSLIDGREVATGEGLVKRDYMFTADAGDALAAVLDSDLTGAVNVATGDAPEVRDLVGLVAETVGRPELVRFGARPSPAGEAPEIRADVTRLRDEVGWFAVTEPADAIARTVDWWRSQPGSAA